MLSLQNAVRFGPTVVANDVIEVDSELIPEELDTSVYSYSPASPRHKKFANVLMVDSHVESMTMVELGYEMSSKDLFEELPTNTPIPVPHPYEGTYTASNKLWNGDGRDPIAEKHRKELDGN